MIATDIADRFRVFLFLLAGFLFTGTIVELLTLEHDESAMQLVPYALCLLSIVALVVVWRWRSTVVLWAFRGFMLSVMAGSLLGVFEHIDGNMEFVQELDPSASRWTLLREGLTGGAPMMAPGILAIGAVVSIAATYSWEPQVASERSRAGAPTSWRPEQQT